MRILTANVLAKAFNQIVNISLRQETPDLAHSGWLAIVGQNLLSVADVMKLCRKTSSRPALLFYFKPSTQPYEAIYTSLMMICLHSRYRRLNGFNALVQQQFIDFGYCWQVDSESLQTIDCWFYLFLDCAWQLLQNNPDSFEFNQNFLVEWALHSHSGDSGHLA